jgi:hypothetical protein
LTSPHEPPADEEIKPDADDLLVFIDDTGHETFAGNQGFYGLGACVVLGAGYAHLKAQWGAVRTKATGSPDAPLHASTIERKPENFAALSEFFLGPSFIRIAVTTTKSVGLPPDMHPCVPVMGQLRQEIATVASVLPCKRIWIIVESSQRADPIVRNCFDQLASLNTSQPLPVERLFMPKSSNEHGLEVADFIVSAASSEVQRRMRGKPGHAPDFNDVFCRLAAEGCRYREIARATDHGDGLVSVDGVGLARKREVRGKSVPEMQTPAQIQKHLSDIVWSHTGRSTVGFVGVDDGPPASLGSGTLVRFGNVVGVLTCAHVLEALLKQKDIGILCFPVRSNQIQRLQLPMATTDSVAIGATPWSESGPDLAFLRLPPPILGDIEKLATIVNGDRQRQIIVAGDPENTMKLCAMAGVIDEMTKPPIIERSPKVIVATTPFEALLNVGHLFVDDEGTDRFRFQPIVSEGVILPTSYEGTSGGGLWKFYLAHETFSLVQARIIGVAYWQKPVGSELHLVGHGQVSIYDHLLNIIRQKWP